jgi:hypothetical protein
VTKQKEKQRIEELTERALAGIEDDDDDEDDDTAGSHSPSRAGSISTTSASNNKTDGQYILQNGIMKFQKKKKKIENFTFSFKIRKKHYELKLERIDAQMKSHEEEQVKIDITRVQNTSQLFLKQKRLIEIQSEIDRIVNYDGIEIVSNVLQGVEMTYLLTILKQLLQD